MYRCSNIRYILLYRDHIAGVMVSMLKSLKIGSCSFFAKQAALRSKSKDWLSCKQEMCPSGATCLPQTKLLVQCKADNIIISSKCNCSPNDVLENMVT